jgi:hypothetical protein
MRILVVGANYRFGKVVMVLRMKLTAVAVHILRHLHAYGVDAV